MGRAHAAGVRVLGQALSEVHAPADVQGAARPARCPATRRRSRRCSRRSRSPNDADLDEFRRGIDPLASTRPARRAARAVSRRASRTRPASRDYLAGLLRAFAGYPVAVELRHRSWSDRHRRHARAAEHVRRRLGADRRAEVPLLDPAELPAERRRASTTCACTAGTPRSGGATRSPRTATTISYSADELKEFTETAERRDAAGEEALSLHEQSLLGEVGRQRRDDQAAARRAGRGRVPAAFVERYPELAGVVRSACAPSLLHVHLPDHVAALEASPARRRPR